MNPVPPTAPQGDSSPPGRTTNRVWPADWPIRLSIASVVVGAMVLLASVIMGMGWVGARQSLLDTAALSARDAGLLISEKSRRMLEPSQSTLRQLSFDPIAGAKTQAQRLARLHVLADELAANPLISAVYLAHADGSFLLVRALDHPAMRERFNAPPKANFLVQSMAKDASGRLVGEFLFYTANNNLLQRRAEPAYRFDPRTRGWYQSAVRTSAPTLSAPYVFFTTRQVGLTLSQSSRAGDAVFGIDVVLDDLADSLDGMRMTPNTQLALVDAAGAVLAHPDMDRVLVQGEDAFTFRHVADINEPALHALHTANPPKGQAEIFDSGGREMLGVVMPFDVWHSQSLALLVVAPVDELLGDLAAKRRRLWALVLGMALLMLPLGWWAGGRIGRSLDRLTHQAQRIARFDFSVQRQAPTLVREVNQLSGVMADMGQTIQRFLHLSQHMATEPDTDRMLDAVLGQLVEATGCRAGAVYLWDEARQFMQLTSATGPDQAHFLADFPYPSERVGRSALPPGGSDLAQVDVELRGRTGGLQGLLVLVHTANDDHADPAFLDFTHKLSGMLAVSIETRQLMAAQKDLLDAVIRLMADAIDAKSPYTGGHCERVPELATALVDRLCADTSGPYADFRMSDEQRHEFYLGAWLHDCGKVTSPEYIVDKATKLEVIYNRIHEVRTRFEVLWRDAEIAHLQRLATGANATASQAERDARHAQLQSDFAFVAQCNVGGEFMADEALARLQAIAGQTWQRHFDNRLGLATEEASRLAKAQPQAPTLPVAEPLLANRPEHVVPWGERKPAVEKGDPRNVHGFDMKLPATQQNMGELYNLATRRGTLTDEDRFKINDHIVQTYVMLKGLPWPAQWARVPEIAATHHEKMDGNGYPRKLPAERLTVADRVMALADVFEALTAADRPYKAPKTLNESLRIMAFMCKDRHLDAELFRYFLRSGLWRSFAEQYMQPAQRDAVDVAAIEALLPPPPAAPVQAA